MLRDSRLVHALLGNDTAPWVVALARGLLSGLLTGALAFFGVWSQTDDVKVLITAGMVPFLTTLMLRWGLEGGVDSRKQGQS